MTMLLDQLNTLLQLIAAYPQYHARDSDFYRFVDGVVKHAFHEVQPEFEAGQPVVIGELGSVVLPYEKMGAIDSIDLFGLDELMMFAFYYRNRGRYSRAADIGANLGLHSILLCKSGYEVEAFEPDPQHHAKLVRNLKLNDVTGCVVHMAAVSERIGTMQFVRVLGNTTSSHLAGAKAKPYGDLERFDVEVRDIREIAARVDLMKIDAEGHEAVILKALPIEAWNRVDAFVEIGTQENAQSVYTHFERSGVNIFSQKRGWGRVERLEDVPKSYKEGGVFLSTKRSMPW
jgi:FkbM family methyltransferase